MTKPIITLKGLNNAIDAAQSQLHHYHDGDPVVVEQLKEKLRKARENLRVFTYKAKPCLTPSGRVLRP